MRRPQVASGFGSSGSLNTRALKNTRQIGVLTCNEWRVQMLWVAKHKLTVPDHVTATTRTHKIVKLHNRHLGYAVDGFIEKPNLSIPA